MRGLRHSGPPLHLTLFVTGRCNLRCRHCFHFEEVAEGVPGPSLENLERLAESCAQLGPQLWLSLGGGEPFMREDLVEIARAFGARGLRHLAIPTNGLIKSQPEQVEALLAACPDTFVSIAISIDGPPAIHDAIRQVEGGHARSLEAFRGLRAQAERHERLGAGLILTLTKENQDSLAGHLEELVRELRPDNVTINLARGTALDTGLLEVDLDAYAQLVATKKRLLREGLLSYFQFPLAKVAVARDELMYEHVARVAAAGEADLGSAHLPCTAGKLSAVVFENGEVRPCEMLDDSFGNLNDVNWDLAALWKSKAAEQVRDTIRETRCKCTWECAQADNVLFNARTWPQLIRRMART